MARAIDWTQYDQLKAQGLGDGKSPGNGRSPGVPFTGRRRNVEL